MERLAEWIWRRWKHHFEAVVLTTAVVATSALVSIPGLGIVIPIFFPLLPRETVVTWNAIAVAVLAVLVPVGSAVAGRRFFALVRRWVAGEVEVAEDLFRMGLTAPRSISLPVGFAIMVIESLSAAVYGAHALGGSWQAYAIICTASSLLVAIGTAIIAVGFEHLARPLLREVAHELGGGTSGRAKPGWWGVGSRLLLIAALIAWAVGMMSAAVATQFTSDLARFGGALISSALATALLILGYFRTFGLQPVLQPIDDLIAGTTRVADGDLTSRLLVTSDDELGVLTESFNTMVDGLAERERLHAAFGSYVDPALAERLLAQGDDLFQGEEVNVTVFFADIRNFTTYAEHATASEAVARLNSLWDIIVPILRDHRGHANKFLGDGVLAVFGVPEELADHADHAVAAACEIQQRVRESFGAGMRIGIGINTGNVIAGTIGGGGKLEFTLIGDPINVAARVEQMTKETGDSILLTQATVDALHARPTNLDDRGAHVVRGRDATVNVYSIAPRAHSDVEKVEQ